MDSFSNGLHSDEFIPPDYSEGDFYCKGCLNTPCLCDMFDDLPPKNTSLIPPSDTVYPFTGHSGLTPSDTDDLVGEIMARLT